MRSNRVFGASDSQCLSRNCPGFDPSTLRHSRIWGAADEAVLNKVGTLKKYYAQYCGFWMTFSGSNLTNQTGFGPLYAQLVIRWIGSCRKSGNQIVYFCQLRIFMRSYRSLSPYFMFSMYGAVFEREKWISTFIQQNHEAALRQAAPLPNQQTNHPTQPWIIIVCLCFGSAFVKIRIRIQDFPSARTWIQRAKPVHLGLVLWIRISMDPYFDLAFLDPDLDWIRIRNAYLGTGMFYDLPVPP